MVKDRICFIGLLTVSCCAGRVDTHPENLHHSVMRMSNWEPLKYVGKLLTIILAAVSVGCFEGSTVVKVKRDGSGIIHVRNHTAALLLNDKPAEGADGKVPTEEELIAYASKLGPDVTFQSFKKTNNRSGWPGYEVIYAFEDINTVQIESLMIPDKESKNKPNPEEVEVLGGKGGGFKFRMDDGMLTIVSLSPFWTPDSAGKGESEPTGALEGAVDPFADEPVSEVTKGLEVSLTSGVSGIQGKLVQAMLKGARLGFFVEVDGEIASTDAQFRKENLITLIDLELEKAFTGITSLEKSMKAAKTQEEAQELVNEAAGIVMDVRPEISVTLK